MEKLNDIKSIEIISFEVYEVIFLLLFLTIVILIFFAVNIYFFKKKTPLVSEEFFQKDSKKLAYNFTLFAKQNKDVNLENELSIILKKLEKYKYHKEEIAMELEMIEAMKAYIQKLEENVSYK